MNKTGKFVISLDFELLWGMRDHKTIEDYGENILGVWDVVPRMLKLFDKYDVAATFATVGFLFASKKEELLEFSPQIKPGYSNINLSPYNGHFDLVKDSESEDRYHFASELIALIRQYPAQEIATHTYSHYYCNSDGQTIEDFRRDIEAAIAIANRDGIRIQSLVFPRNMFNEEYIRVCEENGISSYRGNEEVWFHKSEGKTSKIKGMSMRGFRLLNSYLNISGHHCYTYEEMAAERPYNIPSSRFLRPYSSRLRFFEGLRKKRILKSMTYAAKRNLMFHLWWHPHNFGKDQEENFALLEAILKHYKELNAKYGFTSITMGALAEEMDRNNG
ncbi:MAG: polysaccharide deacetylase family protein [Flavobacteriaceae bacterium]